MSLSNHMGRSPDSRAIAEGVRWDRMIIGFATAVTAVLHLMTAGRYGMMRNELYFLVCGWHPAFGYADQPPLVPLLAAATQMFGQSVWMLRLPVVIAATMLVKGWMLELSLDAILDDLHDVAIRVIAICRDVVPPRILRWFIRWFGRGFWLWRHGLWLMERRAWWRLGRFTVGFRERGRRYVVSLRPLAVDWWRREMGY